MLSFWRFINSNKQKNSQFLGYLPPTGPKHPKKLNFLGKVVLCTRKSFFFFFKPMHLRAQFFRHGEQGETLVRLQKLI